MKPHMATTRPMTDVSRTSLRREQRKAEYQRLRWPTYGCRAWQYSALDWATDLAILRHIVTALNGLSCRKYHVWAERNWADDRIRKNKRWKAARPLAVTTCEHLLLQRELMLNFRPVLEDCTNHETSFLACRLDEGEN